MLFTKDRIKNCVDMSEAIALIEEGFARYSQNEAVIPPFGTLHFDEPKGETHLKYGYIKKQDFYVVKVASNFPDNFLLGLPSNQGVMLVFSRLTGELKAILNDEGYLSDIRTAAAGAAAAKYLAPAHIRGIGIVGTGAQAFYQLSALKHITECRDVFVWGRSPEKLRRFVLDPELSSFRLNPTHDLALLAENCNLIITTTSSSAPLLFTEHVKPGCHITAVGADDLGKQELDSLIFEKADIVAVDSREQCFRVGDSSIAVRNGHLDASRVVELGEIILNPALGRTSDAQITIADLTGVAVQDIQIATCVLKKLSEQVGIK